MFQNDELALSIVEIAGTVTWCLLSHALTMGSRTASVWQLAANPTGIFTVL